MPIPRDPPNPPVTRWGATWRVAFVVGLGLVVWLGPAAGRPRPGHFDRVWMYAVDPILGIALGVLAIWRRRWPGRIALIEFVLGTFSASAGGAVLLVLASVATRRRWRELAWVVPLNIVLGVVAERIYPAPSGTSGLLSSIAFITLLIAAVTAVGYAVGGRRELDRERSESAERDQARRIAQAAAGERTRIAREMHDVLAHRISLVAMHAGALNYRTDLTPEQMSQALATIETNAHQALADLREVLGVLREPRSGDLADAPEPPQPGLADLPELIAEAQTLGTRIAYADSTLGEVPAGLGRTAYRVVQEALTNARKHAPGALVTVRLAGGAPAGLQVEVRNPRALQPADHALPRSGLGLLGLQERVGLAGGRLRHGRQPDGGYLVHAWLPWPAPTTGAPQ